MPFALSEAEIMRVFDEAHELGVKLEIHQGLPIWEMLPAPIHTIAEARIRNSIRVAEGGAGCGCHVFQDMSIRFPDGSLKRPDLAIYCEPPPATQESTTVLPPAAIEVVSPGSEIKDLELNPPFYLLHGIRDVVVFDPRTDVVVHYRVDGRKQYTSPVELTLECGCVVTV